MDTNADITLDLVPPFAEAHLPLTTVFAQRHLGDLVTVTEGEPQHWPLIDRIVARCSPSLRPDIFGYYGQGGPDLEDLIAPADRAELDGWCVQQIHNVLLHYWSGERIDLEVWRHHGDPRQTHWDSRSSCCAHDVTVELRDARILVEINPSKNTDWTATKALKVLNICSAIFARQRPFLQSGKPALSPMSVSSVARDVSYHESTVSRSLAYLTAATPYECLFIRELFAGPASKADPSPRSRLAALDAVSRLVEEEDIEAPLTDEELMIRLRHAGFHVARRTVAKYRDELGILPARLRK